MFLSHGGRRAKKAHLSNSRHLTIHERIGCQIQCHSPLISTWLRARGPVLLMPLRCTHPASLARVAYGLLHCSCISRSTSFAVRDTSFTEFPAPSFSLPESSMERKGLRSGIPTSKGLSLWNVQRAASAGCPSISASSSANSPLPIAYLLFITVLNPHVQCGELSISGNSDILYSPTLIFMLHTHMTLLSKFRSLNMLSKESDNMRFTNRLCASGMLLAGVGASIELRLRTYDEVSDAGDWTSMLAVLRGSWLPGWAAGDCMRLEPAMLNTAGWDTVRSGSTAVRLDEK